jgi:hypothetical protein
MIPKSVQRFSEKIMLKPEAFGPHRFPQRYSRLVGPADSQDH